MHRAAACGVVSACCITSSLPAASTADTPPPIAPENGTAGGAPSAHDDSEAAAHTVEPRDPSPPTGIPQELDAIRPGVAIKRSLDEFAARTNLRLGLAHTLLFQQASGGTGDRTAAGGDLDLLARWTLIGAGTKDTGILSFAGEYRYQIGDQPPAELGAEIGTLNPTTNGFGERSPTVKEFYWDQRVLEDRLRFVVGRVDPENLFGGHRLQSANLYFLNKVFSSNTTIAFPGSGMAAGVQVKPAPWLYIDGGIADANGVTTQSNFEGFFEDGEFLYFTESALTPTIEGVGAGRYRVALWHISEREDAGVDADGGVTVSVDQDFGERWTAFVRYGHADGDATGITDSAQGGFGFKNLLHAGDMVGLALAWSKPKDDDEREEKVAEVFIRFQVTEVAQLTFGSELILDPGNAPGDDVLGVFSVRLRLSF